MVLSYMFLSDAFQYEEVLVSLHSVVLLLLLSSLTLTHTVLSQELIGFVYLQFVDLCIHESVLMNLSSHTL